MATEILEILGASFGKQDLAEIKNLLTEIKTKLDGETGDTDFTGVENSLAEIISKLNDVLSNNAAAQTSLDDINSKTDSIIEKLDSGESVDLSPLEEKITVVDQKIENIRNMFESITYAEGESV